MSRNNIKKPFCKVCHDAGKPESEYTSHWVKDLTGKTTCPTLLNTECRFCHKLGHTAKFCKELNKKPATNPVVKVTKPTPKPSVTSAFAALDEDSEEEEEEEKEEPVQKNDWASIAAKPKSFEQVMKPSGFVTLSRNTNKNPEPLVEKKPKPIQAPVPAPKPMKSWADLSDEEDEDECADYEEAYDESW